MNKRGIHSCDVVHANVSKCLPSLCPHQASPVILKFSIACMSNPEIACCILKMPVQSYRHALQRLSMEHTFDYLHSFPSTPCSSPSSLSLFPFPSSLSLLPSFFLSPLLFPFLLPSSSLPLIMSHTDIQGVYIWCRKQHIPTCFFSETEKQCGLMDYTTATYRVSMQQ